METILIMAAAGAMCCICFFLGAKVGQTVSKGDEIKTPKIDPLKTYRENEERKAAKAEQDRMAIIMQNIEAYDGTGNGQRDVP